MGGALFFTGSADKTLSGNECAGERPAGVAPASARAPRRRAPLLAGSGPGSLGSPLPSCSRGSCVGGLGRRLCARPAPRRPGHHFARARVSLALGVARIPRWLWAPAPATLLSCQSQPSPAPRLVPLSLQPDRPLSCELPWGGAGNGEQAAPLPACVWTHLPSLRAPPPPRRPGCWSLVHVCPLGPLGGAGAGLTPPLAGAAHHAPLEA